MKGGSKVGYAGGVFLITLGVLGIIVSILFIPFTLGLSLLLIPGCCVLIYGGSKAMTESKMRRKERKMQKRSFKRDRDNRRTEHI